MFQLRSCCPDACWSEPRLRLCPRARERASAEFARKNLVAKAQARPDLVRDVVAKIQRDGLAATLGTLCGGNGSLGSRYQVRLGFGHVNK